MRDLQNNFFALLMQSAIAMYEKYNQENSDMEGLPEEARLLLQDKDSLVNALQVGPCTASFPVADQDVDFGMLLWG